ncbi:hypothetical protein G7047_21330 [Diaphorobacter sp. HDW4A]|uniref:hypothetical protein n=1 Tax=Diaphorobacter sp. HDW4A TaxID=2714924 RepID=UPI00140C620F|nr:hypothetical protein [Diaphorobacter sp. HDW4A]QIL82187.1 hypothetical protein G7047_21330 [Diaphorobacter sp. HDW4A]
MVNLSGLLSSFKKEEGLMSGRSSRPGMDSPKLAQLRNTVDRPEHWRTRTRRYPTFRRSEIVAINLSKVRVNMIQK